MDSDSSPDKPPAKKRTIEDRNDSNANPTNSGNTADSRAQTHTSQPVRPAWFVAAHAEFNRILNTLNLSPENKSSAASVDVATSNLMLKRICLMSDVELRFLMLKPDVEMDSKNFFKFVYVQRFPQKKSWIVSDFEIYFCLIQGGTTWNIDII